MSHILNEVHIYVGTYQKYNEGNLFGKWLTLSNYDDIEAFYADCKRLHQDEKDPELMFQDWECPKIFDGYIDECYLQETIFEIASLLEEKSDDDMEIIQNYMYLTGMPLNEQIIEQAQERYIGYFSSETDFAEYYVEQTGLLQNTPNEVAMYFDYQAYARDLILEGAFSEHNNHYFYNY